MKILVVHNYYKSNLIGGEDVIVNREIAFLKDALGAENVLIYSVKNDDIRPKEILMNIWGNHRHGKNIQKLIQEHQIDLMHVHNEFPMLTPLIFKYAHQAGCKVIQTLHNFRQQCLSGLLYKKNAFCHDCVNKAFKWPGILHHCYRNSVLQSGVHAFAQLGNHIKKYDQYVHAYFVLSHFQESLLKSFGVHPNRLLLKPNFMTGKISTIPPEQRDGYVFIGRIEQAKGIHALLSVWGTLPKHFKLTVVGDGPDLNKCRQLYPNDNIEFKGLCDANTVQSILQKSLYLIHSSLCYETFGLTILEAMQYAVPVIGLDIGTRKEFIQNNHNGFLTSLTQLKSTIKRSWVVPNYPELCENAQKTAAHYHQDQIGQLQLQHYENTIQG